ncbi:MAG: nitronate monooxygenase [Alicyclobacillus mali]|uniref:NAD(P)H-dependent flavin oxidoreductase n=1 Tax=Alicyclobacillus mali (ex Roth et al. 2021) TaxID=1123961 RepID=UPI0023F2E187|nr:nitronate monooxygenase [Alicyclobacillus mali (ex Roth et al. 2021)]MCL6487368.1 nitronate monooxygenase [Alicyclobacillus mali (ex Roth et al. 2021)]
MRTRLTELLGIQLPIIQGGLANLAYAELAAAVSNAGGLGQITATSLPDAASLRREIERTRRLTTRPFGVNLAISQHKDVAALVEVIVEERVPAVTLTGGNPEPILRRLADTDIRKLVLVSAVRQAQKAEALGADAVMAVGQEGGGHIGRADTGTLVLVPRVAESVAIPVVASGGIADGRGLAAALALGAEGIEMGTRFVATQECIAHAAYKAAIVAGDIHETTVIKRSIGAPGRVLPSRWVEEILAREGAGTTPAELYPYVAGERNKTAALEGRLDEGYAWVGQSMGLIRSIPTVAELFADIVRDARRAAMRLSDQLQD